MTDDLVLAQLRDLVECAVLILGVQRGDAGDTAADPAVALTRIEALQTAIAARRSDQLPSTLLRERFALSATEEQVLLLFVAIAMHPQVRAALAVGSQPDPTLDTIRQLVYGVEPSRQAFDELGPRGTLRRFALIERSDGGGPDVHETRQTWSISRRVLTWLHGDMSLATEVADIARLAESTGRLDDLAMLASLVEEASDALATTDSLVIASGRKGLGRRSLLATAAAERGLCVLEIDASALAADAMDVQLRLLARECRLLGCVLLVRDVDVLVGDTNERLDALGRLLAREVAGPILVTCGLARLPMKWGRPIVTIHVKPPTHEQLASLWLRELGQGTQDDAEYLASQYLLAPALVHHAARTARTRAKARPISPDDVYAGIRSAIDERLADHATRVEVTQTWNDLVLPDGQLEAVQYLIARIRRRQTVHDQWGFGAKVGKGLGTTALFSGAPGTGKTMVAALVAKELGLDLYQVDMAKVVSKWIGETERNLAALFDAAESGHSVLLFDEADSLFGKRTDVKSSNDRHANLETNYLLQRLERFTGICLLTSNHESNIDPAFNRRLALHVRFELPDADERAALWRAMLPASAPVAPNLDTASLARRYVMSGGYIRNAALRAAFMAADEDSVITSAHFERAAKLEYEAMGKIAVG
jgi:hypothetical protein